MSNTSSLPICRSLPESILEENFCSTVIPAPFNTPRSILSVNKGEFLVLSRGDDGAVMRVFDSDSDGIPDKIEKLEGTYGGNHGLAYRDGYLYISDDEYVWRWRYDLGNSTVLSGRETVVINMDRDGKGGAPGGHKTRTIVFDEKGRMYVSVGSGGNVDEDSHRSRIRRLNIPNQTSELPLDFQNAEVFADGLRNEVGLAFDKHGILWGVENGADNLYREDFGGDIHNDNPAEELNRFPESMAGSHWGYPECWTEYSLSERKGGLGRGTQHAWPGFEDVVTDQECRENRVPSALAMQAHSAPLGIVFYNYIDPINIPEGCTGQFPKYMDGYAFIAFHGSWNRDVPTGYKVVYVKMTEDGMADSDPIDLLKRDSRKEAKWSSGYRPVDLDFDECGRLLVTSKYYFSTLTTFFNNKCLFFTIVKLLVRRWNKVQE